MSERNTELIGTLASLQNKLNKFEEFENFKKKADGILITHEVRINSTANDIDQLRFKYDKAITDNLTVKGYIGSSCRYKSIGEYLMNNFNEMAKLKNEKEMLKKDIKDLKTRFESLMKTFLSLVDSNYIKCNQYTNSKIKEIEINLADIINDLNIKVKEAVIQMNTSSKKTEDYTDDSLKRFGEFFNEKIQLMEDLDKKLNDFESAKDNIKKENESITKEFKNINNNIKTSNSKFNEFKKYMDEFRKQIISYYKKFPQRNSIQVFPSNPDMLQTFELINKMKQNNQQKKEENNTNENKINLNEIKDNDTKLNEIKESNEESLSYRIIIKESKDPNKTYPNNNEPNKDRKSEKDESDNLSNISKTDKNFTKIDENKRKNLNQKREYNDLFRNRSTSQLIDAETQTNNIHNEHHNTNIPLIRSPLFNDIKINTEKINQFLYSPLKTNYSFAKTRNDSSSPDIEHRFTEQFLYTTKNKQKKKVRIDFVAPIINVKKFNGDYRKLLSVGAEAGLDKSIKISSLFGMTSYSGSVRKDNGFYNNNNNHNNIDKIEYRKKFKDKIKDK